MNKSGNRQDRVRIGLFLIILTLSHVGLVWGIVRIATGHFNTTHLGGLLGGYFLRALAVTLVLHRLLTHETFTTPRWLYKLFCIWGCSPLQGKLCFWSGMHHEHHAHSDEEGDPHSPALIGFFDSHMGWLLRLLTQKERDAITHVQSQLPIAACIDKLYLVWGLMPMVICGFWGYEMVIWCNLVPLALGYHVTWSVNSLGHMIGLRPVKKTGDESRNLAIPIIRIRQQTNQAQPHLLRFLTVSGAVTVNAIVFLTNLVIGLIYVGENLHGGHHSSQRSAKFGWAWWQPDPGYGIVLILRYFGLVTSITKSTLRPA